MPLPVRDQRLKRRLRFKAHAGEWRVSRCATWNADPESSRSQRQAQRVRSRRLTMQRSPNGCAGRSDPTVRRGTANASGWGPIRSLASCRPITPLWVLILRPPARKSSTHRKMVRSSRCPYCARLCRNAIFLWASLR